MRLWPACLCALALLIPPASATDVYIGLQGNRATRVWSIGLAPFIAQDPRRPEDAESSRLARGVVRDDLLFSRYFNVVEQGPPADLTDPAAVNEEWKKRGAAFLLGAQVSQIQSQLTLSVKLQDLGSGETVLERYYRQNAKYWRSAAHRVADDIVRQLTGRPGIAGSQIAFVNDQTGSQEIYLADYDGANIRRLTSDRSIVLLPRWSPDKHSLAFTSYKDGNPDLFLYDLEHGTVRPLSNHQGLNLAGGFSPDGNRLAATLSRQKNPNIYILGLRDSSESRVTEHFGADSSPTFSPDGENIAFVSDRSGNPQVHTLEINTGRTRRLTRLNWCDTPAWSPTGEWIAFSGRAHPKDPMDIFVVDIMGTRLIQLTHGEDSNEDPSWSSDGRFLAFTSGRNGRRQIFIMDADGSAPHALDIPGNSRTPSWSP